MARLQSTAAFFNVAIQETAEATHRAIVDLAKREHGKVLRDNGGRPLPFTRFVDGQKGAPEEAVSARGVIQYDYHRLEEVVAFAMQTLLDFSPVLKDEYRQAHTLFVNGVSVPNLKDWQTGDDVVILNLTPYSRKIEQGRMKMRLPGSDHVYERAAVAIRRRYGNIAQTRFEYRSWQAGKRRAVPYKPAGVLTDTLAAKYRLSRKEARAKASGALRLEHNTRVPALVFYEYV